MNALPRILRYLRSRKTPATAPEIARGIHAHDGTVRRLLGRYRINGVRYYGICYGAERRCRATGIVRGTYWEIRRWN